MPDISANLGLNLPKGTDFFDYDVHLRQNFQKIDDQLKSDIVETYTSSAGQTVVNMVHPYTLGTGALSVRVDGVPQFVGSGYTETSTTSITFTEGLVDGQNIEIVIQGLAPASDARFNEIDSQLAEKASQKRIKDISVNVKDFGAVGDWNGTTGTDNLQPFKDAVNALPSTGGEVLISDGDFWLSDSWNIDKDNVTVKIMPSATVRTTNPTSSGQTIGFIGYLGSGTAITPQRKNGKIYGGGYVRNISTGTNENAIGVSRYNGFTCDGIQIPEANRKAITCQYGVDNINIENNDIGNSGNNAISIENTCTTVRVKNNIVENTSGNGVHITTSCENVVIEENTVKQATGLGIYSGGSSSNVKIKKNKINNADKGIEANTGSDITISDNTIIHTTRMGIRAANITDGALVVSRNKVADVQTTEAINFESCTTKPVLNENTVTGATHTYALNVTAMGGYEPLLQGNKMKTGTLGLLNGWKPKFMKDIVDGSEYVIENGKRIMFGTAAPTTGTYAVGDKVINTTPTAGGYEGWICTSAGTPGTWKGYGLLQA